MLTTNYLYQKQYLATAKFIVPRKKKYFFNGIEVKICM